MQVPKKQGRSGCGSVTVDDGDEFGEWEEE